MKEEHKFAINIPSGSFLLALAVGIVYNWRLGLAAFTFVVLVGTIVEYFTKRK